MYNSELLKQVLTTKRNDWHTAVLAATGMTDEVTRLEIEKEEDIVDDEEDEHDEFWLVDNLGINLDQYLGGEEFEEMILDEGNIFNWFWI